jgi:hypothetical protein
MESIKKLSLVGRLRRILASKQKKWYLIVVSFEFDSL